MNFHGYHRATGDMDVWIAVSAENSAKVVDAYAEFGFASLGLKPESFNRENVMLTVGASPLKIEVMTSIDGVNFEECFRERFQMTYDDILLNIISLDQLLKNTAATGRLKDQADVEELEKRR